MKKLTLLLMALTITAVGTTGCGRRIFELGPAPIENVEVGYQKADPIRVVVSIRGRLEDSCTSFNDITDERTGNIISINVTVRREERDDCAPRRDTFDRTVDLGTDFAVGGEYTVHVNGVTENFTMPGAIP